MHKFNKENEKIKRWFLEYLDGADGLTQSTIQFFEDSINLWEEFTQNSDYKNFNAQTAKKFKTWLSTRKNARTSKIASIRTRHNYLKRLERFFRVIASRPGYKSKISMTDVSYLKLNRAETMMALSPSNVKHPTLNQVLKVIHSIKPKTEVDMRDKALLTLMTLTGARARALVTLPLECIDLTEQRIYQNPKKNVKTKFSKDITTTFFFNDESLLEIITSWVNYLKQEKLFNGQDPLFPATQVILKNKNSATFSGNQISNRFWKTTGSLRLIFKKRFEQAGVEYFHPHTFRHMVAKQAYGKARLGEELKAISQNLGHEKMDTTWEYNRVPDERVDIVIKNLGKKSNNYTDTQGLQSLEKKIDLLIEKGKKERKKTK